MRPLTFIFVAFLMVPLILTGCSGGGAPATSSAAGQAIKVSWQPNHEAAVNRPGGGYRLYYATSANAALASTTQVEVPYVSGATAPTSATVSLMPGTYYFRISAYSALNGGSLSTASAEVSLSVP